MSTDSFRLNGKLAVVTGGASGIGKAIAHTFAARGAAVHILDLDGESAGHTAREIGGAGGSAVAHRCDVTDRADVTRVFGKILVDGRIDILVNNAGCNVRKPALDVTWDEWNTVLDTNLRGMFFVSQAIATRSIN